MKNLCFRYLIGFSLLALTLGVGACLVFPNNYEVIPPGPWRGIIKLEYNPVTPNPRGEPLPDKVDLQFEEVTEGQVPFNFNVTYASPDSVVMTLKNAQQNLVVENIIYGRNRATGDDTIRFYFPQGDTYLRGKYAGGVIEGEWVETQSPDNRISFVAYHGKDHRFTTLQKVPITDLSGRWAITLGLDMDSTYAGVLTLDQNRNHLTGRLETPEQTIDYLEGTAQEDKLYLSYFDGEQAILIEGKVMDDRRLIGSFRSGLTVRTIWEAERNSEAVVPASSSAEDAKE